MKYLLLKNVDYKLLFETIQSKVVTHLNSWYNF